MSLSRSPRPALTSSSSGPIQYEVHSVDSAIQIEGQTRRTYQYSSWDPRTYQYSSSDPRTTVASPRSERTSAPSSRHGSSSRGHASRKGSAHSDGTVVIEHNRKHDPRVIEMHQHTRGLEEENSKLRGHISELSARNDQLEQELQLLQEDRFQRMPDARYTPMEDSRIQHELETLRACIARTGKRFALTAVDRSSCKSRNGLHDLHKAVMEVASTSGLPNSSCLLEAIADDAALPRLLLTAMLSRFVHQRFLQDPFFFANTDDDNDGTDWGEYFADAMSHGWITNPAQVNIWRSDTLRHLFPSNDNDKASRRLSARGDSLVRQASQLGAAEFAAGPARLLLHEMNDAAEKSYQDELLFLFDKAARTSVTLWRERLAFECHYLRDLDTQRFSIESQEMQAHPRHLLDDPTDHRLDGRRVRIVVHPSVVGLGTPDGDRYQTASRILAKAVVCLDEAESEDKGAATDTRVEKPDTVPVPTAERMFLARSPPPFSVPMTEREQDESDHWWSLKKDKRKKKRAT
ncbi:hypothetical protein DOTSEDRAFT_71987 [Dothistroma septosporum NZE10]|uniref:Uncharacterized protein n=1 Tax=Dothistroma septosporum (strain NZE10 / CBS 128990) TaxID=675120 RepID=N1PPN1_DOTSN|nr:hypothetical protein DOTSEDRAFT_71987 [Dothistroma septosporum NZE10]